VTTIEEVLAWSARLEQDVADLAAGLQQVQQDLADAVAGGGGSAPVPGDEKPMQREFPTLDAWVEQWLAPVFARNTDGSWRWCAEWWRHAEATFRLDTLHRSWEIARLDPNGKAMTGWLRDLDAQIAALGAAEGTFASCGREHRQPPVLPTEPPPDGWYARAFHGSGTR
jgi:hypothetical protein